MSHIVFCAALRSWILSFKKGPLDPTTQNSHTQTHADFPHSSCSLDTKHTHTFFWPTTNCPPTKWILEELNGVHHHKSQLKMLSRRISASINAPSRIVLLYVGNDMRWLHEEYDDDTSEIQNVYGDHVSYTIHSILNDRNV